MHCTLLTILMAVCQQLLKCGRGWGSSQVLAGQDGHHVTRADVLPLLGQVPRTGKDLVHTPMGEKYSTVKYGYRRSSRNEWFFNSVYLLFLIPVSDNSNNHNTILRLRELNRLCCECEFIISEVAVTMIYCIYLSVKACSNKNSVKSMIISYKVLRN